MGIMVTKSGFAVSEGIGGGEILNGFIIYLYRET